METAPAYMLLPDKKSFDGGMQQYVFQVEVGAPMALLLWLVSSLESPQHSTAKYPVTFILNLQVQLPTSIYAGTVNTL